MLSDSIIPLNSFYIEKLSPFETHVQQSGYEFLHDLIVEPDLEQRLNLNPSELSELQSMVYSLLLNSIATPSLIYPATSIPTIAHSSNASTAPHLNSPSFFKDELLSNYETFSNSIPCSVKIPIPSSSSPTPTIPKLKWYQRVDAILDSKINSRNGSKIGFLSTGDDGMNQLLGGGIAIGSPGNITEVVGSSGTGKTQFVLQLCLMVQLPLELGGLDGDALYFFCGSPFPYRRLDQLLTEFQIKYPFQSSGLSTNRVFVWNLGDLPTQHHLLLYHLPVYLASHPRIRLIVIDSIASNFRIEMGTQVGEGSHGSLGKKRRSTSFGSYENGGKFHGTSEPPQKLSVLNRFGYLLETGSKLKEYSDRFNVGIVCVNQVSDRFDMACLESTQLTEEFMSLSSKNQTSVLPTMGLTWSHIITTRLLLSRQESLWSPSVLASTHTTKSQNPHDQESSFHDTSSSLLSQTRRSMKLLLSSHVKTLIDLPFEITMGGLFSL